VRTLPYELVEENNYVGQVCANAQTCIHRGEVPRGPSAPAGERRELAVPFAVAFVLPKSARQDAAR